MTDTECLSPRLEALRAALAESIPIVGDETKGRSELGAMTLHGLLGVYVNWMHRLVPARPRRVHFADDFWTALAERNRSAIEAIAQEVECGSDLLPFVSDRAAAEGYAPSRPGKSHHIKWADKDFALNVWGTHHLHLGSRKPDGTIRRTPDLLYVEFSREKAIFMLAGNHKSFDDGTLETAVLQHRAARDTLTIKGITGLTHDYTSAERGKLARHGIMTLAQVGDRFVVSGSASTAGTAIDSTRTAGRMYDALLKFDPKLDDEDFLLGLVSTSCRTPSSDEWRWVLHHCDVCFGQEEIAELFLVLPGPL